MKAQVVDKTNVYPRGVSRGTARRPWWRRPGVSGKQLGVLATGGWRWFRGLAAWSQIAIASLAAVMLVSPFTSDRTQRIVADRGPAVTAEPTSSTREVSVEVATTVATTSTTVAPAAASTPAAGIPAKGDDTSVLRVIDGDTIQVSDGTRVRLIGIDTPETVDPSGPVGCFGPEATRYANALLPVGTRIRLVYDVERLDRFGRTLAYVYRLIDGVFVNHAIARNGFGLQATFPPNVAHAEEFRVAVAEARRANLGLWQACQSTTTAGPVAVAPVAGAPASGPSPRATVVTPTTRVAPAPAAATSAGGCHPSYAGACVPSGFSDVDCAGGKGNGPGYVSAKNFRVVGPDVYGLDSDGDGLACES